MNTELVSIIDSIVNNEFPEHADLYAFEKEQLFATLQQNKNAVQLNEFGEITIGEIPAYILAITSIVNLYLRIKSSRKKARQADLRQELQKNQLPQEVSNVLLHKYAEVLIKELNQALEKEKK